MSILPCVFFEASGIMRAPPAARVGTIATAEDWQQGVEITGELWHYHVLLDAIGATTPTGLGYWLPKERIEEFPLHWLFWGLL